MITVTSLLAIVCIVLGIINGFIDKEDEILFNSLTWFVLAIAFNTLAGITYTVGRKRAA
jgi:hypothetical protein